MRGYRNQVQPAQYVSQYDPAANDRTQQILQTRSNKFDQSYASLAQEQAQQGSMFFLDENAKKQTLDKFNEEKERILQKYEGDFEAAAPELTKLVVQERANPIYQANKYQQQKMAEANQIKAKLGPNAIEVKPVPKDLINPETGRVRSAEEFDYNIAERSDYDKAIVYGLQGVAKSVESGDIKVSNEMAGYFEKISKSGLATLNKDERKKVLDEYSKIFEDTTTFGIDPIFKDEDGNQRITSRQFLEENIDRLIPSGTQSQYMQDRNYVNPKDNNSNYSGFNIPIIPIGKTLAESKTVTDFEDYKDWNQTDPNAEGFKSTKKRGAIKFLKESDPITAAKTDDTVKNINAQLGALGIGSNITADDIISGDARDKLKVALNNLKPGMTQENAAEQNIKYIQAIQGLANTNVYDLLDHYSSIVSQQIANKNLGQNLQWFAPDYSTVDTKEINQMNTRMTGLQHQLDGVSLDRFEILDGPSEATFMNKNDRQRKNDEMYRNLESGKKITAWTIDDKQRVLFQMTDGKGNFYTVSPTDADTRQALISPLDPTGTTDFSGANQATKFVDMFNGNLTYTDPDQTFKSYMENYINKVYPDYNEAAIGTSDETVQDRQMYNILKGYSTAVKKSGYSMNDNIKPITF